ncbi:hypothetical protein [Marinifilum flexuosum]|uniref:Uncharacterized protein n=1 Tax=Marinifilum flexuosum TaxID=1117708 RepID=A0A419X407_9BACT|nr:hypothetical protein [Marinifilum flexuosum]RKE02447.1 hypothetical protein BXY64_2537 [Marinifilum flexuosum]
MMNAKQRKTIFRVFIFIIIVLILGLIASLILSFQGKVNAVPTLLTSGFLATGGVYFYKIIKKEFVDNEILPFGVIKEHYEQRKTGLETTTCESCSKRLVDTSLKYADTILKRKYGKEVQFEIAIFTNMEEPDIEYYYSSTGSKVPTHSHLRKINPKYYEENNYAAVKYMKNPIEPIVMFSDTWHQVDYSHVSDEQKKRVRSQAMFNLCSDTPYVLVITGNKKDMFNQDDNECMELIQAIGNCIRADIELKKTLSVCPKENVNMN